MFRDALLLILVASGAATTLAGGPAKADDQSKILDQALAQTGSSETGFDPANYSVEQVTSGARFEGGYVGGFLAYTRSGIYDSLGPIDGVGSFEGWMAGLDAGVDFKLRGMIAGVVGDIAWADIPATDELGGDLGKIGWGASVRGRFGIDADYLLPYVTAGLAIAGAEFSSSDGLETAGATHIGWTVGIGLEAAVSDQISIDLLYRYSDYGMAEYAYTSPAPTAVERGLTAHQLSLGINYAF